VFDDLYLIDANHELWHTPLKAGKPDVVYHPSNLGFKFPRQFRELAAIGNQWRFFNDAQDSWDSINAVVNVMGAGQQAARFHYGFFRVRVSSIGAGRFRTYFCSSSCYRIPRLLA
jgi:hypothetical protein